MFQTVIFDVFFRWFAKQSTNKANQQNLLSSALYNSSYKTHRLTVHILTLRASLWLILPGIQNKKCSLHSSICASLWPFVYLEYKNVPSIVQYMHLYDHLSTWNALSMYRQVFSITIHAIPQRNFPKKQKEKRKFECHYRELYIVSIVS